MTGDPRDPAGSSPAPVYKTHTHDAEVSVRRRNVVFRGQEKARGGWCPPRGLALARPGRLRNEVLVDDLAGMGSRREARVPPTDRPRGPQLRVCVRWFSGGVTKMESNNTGEGTRSDRSHDVRRSLTTPGDDARDRSRRTCIG